MSDLVKRLRASRAQWTARAGIPSDLETEAADRIDALEAALRTAKMMCRVGMPEYQAEDVVEIIDEALAPAQPEKGER